MIDNYNLEDILIKEQMRYFNRDGFNEENKKNLEIYKKIKEENPNLSEKEIEFYANQIKNREEINKGRRNFMKLIGTGIIATLFPTKTKASDNIEYPPGIANCRDPAIKKAYYYLERYGSEKANRFYSGIAMVESILRDRLIGNDHYMTEKSIKDDTPFIEPAYWFMCAKTDIYPKDEIFKKLKEDNHALYWFKEGIITYFSKWIKGNSGGYDMKAYIEESFLKSIFSAANYTETEVETQVKKYLNSNIKEREQKLKQIMQIYQSYDIDPTANKINDNYDKLLTAEWSSYFLVTHYYKLEKKGKRTMSMFYIIEQGLGLAGKSKLDIRIRGPPDYLN